jgi:hypothetical protein
MFGTILLLYLGSRELQDSLFSDEDYRGHWINWVDLGSAKA